MTGLTKSTTSKSTGPKEAGSKSPPKGNGPKNTGPRRVRRTGEESRRLILDAAEKRLAKIGPEGIRLQDIAKDVGISHPAILHHFQSREGLVAALVDRTMAHLRDALMGVITRGQARNIDTDAMLDEVFATLSDRGHARLLAWLILTNRVRPEDEPETSGGSGGHETLSELTDLVHDFSARQAAEHGYPVPDKADTRFFILLAAMSAFGEAIVGKQMYRAAGLGDDPNAAANFRARLKTLLDPRLR